MPPCLPLRCVPPSCRCSVAVSPILQHAGAMSSDFFASSWCLVPACLVCWCWLLCSAVPWCCAVCSGAGWCYLVCSAVAVQVLSAGCAQVCVRALCFFCCAVLVPVSFASHAAVLRSASVLTSCAIWYLVCLCAGAWCAHLVLTSSSAALCCAH